MSILRLLPLPHLSLVRSYHVVETGYISDFGPGIKSRCDVVRYAFLTPRLSHQPGDRYEKREETPDRILDTVPKNE